MASVTAARASSQLRPQGPCTARTWRPDQSVRSSHDVATRAMSAGGHPCHRLVGGKHDWHLAQPQLVDLQQQVGEEVAAPQVHHRRVGAVQQLLDPSQAVDLAGTVPQLRTHAALQHHSWDTAAVDGADDRDAEAL